MMQTIMRGSSATCPGDSGGPVFDFYGGFLIGVNVGNQTYKNQKNELGEYGLKSHIVPIIAFACI